MFSRIGLGQLLIIFALAAVLFGYKRLPELGRSVGKALKEFKRGIGDDDDKPQSGDGTPKG